jgi:hypothetical protein
MHRGVAGFLMAVLGVDYDCAELMILLAWLGAPAMLFGIAHLLTERKAGS